MQAPGVPDLSSVLIDLYNNAKLH